VDAGLLRSWLNADVPNFYGEWIDGCNGAPLLTLRQVELTSLPAAGGGWASSTGSYVIEQVQDDMFAGWPVFTSGVPYALHCPAASGGALNVFEECTVRPTDVVGGSTRLGMPKLLFGGEGGGELTVDPAVLTNPLPVRMTLYQAHAYLPGVVAQASKVSDWCGSSMAGDCATDADGDGFPVSEDCDDSDAFVNPAAFDRGTDLRDDDCNCYRSYRGDFSTQPHTTGCL
jgi:hypothetical protein